MFYWVQSVKCKGVFFLFLSHTSDEENSLYVYADDDRTTGRSLKKIDYRIYVVTQT
jgi:hypothetical protein